MRYLLFIFVVLLSAQTVSADSYSDISLDLQPAYPQPGEFITASLSTYAYNLQNTEIIWTLDGVLLQKGGGLTSISFQAPQAGSSISLIATIDASTELKRIITPTSVDILWEADSYTPRLYKGRALPSSDTYVRVVAIPHLGTSTPASSLIFNWYKNGRLLTSLSGSGKDTLYTKSPGLYNNYIISVEVLDEAGIKLGQNSVKIKSIEPQVELYTKQPLLGTLFYNALTSPHSGALSSEISIVAIPYYFNIISPQVLTYTWQVTGARSIQNKDKNNISILQAAADVVVFIRASLPDTLLQSASRSHTFGDSSSVEDIYSSNSDYQSPFGTNIE